MTRASFPHCLSPARACGQDFRRPVGGWARLECAETSDRSLAGEPRAARTPPRCGDGNSTVARRQGDRQGRGADHARGHATRHNPPRRHQARHRPTAHRRCPWSATTAGSRPDYHHGQIDGRKLRTANPSSAVAPAEQMTHQRNRCTAEFADLASRRSASGELTCGRPSAVLGRRPTPYDPDHSFIQSPHYVPLAARCYGCRRLSRCSTRLAGSLCLRRHGDGAGPAPYSADSCADRRAPVDRPELWPSAQPHHCYPQVAESGGAV